MVRQPDVTFTKLWLPFATRCHCSKLSVIDITKLVWSIISSRTLPTLLYLSQTVCRSNIKTSGSAKVCGARGKRSSCRPSLPLRSQPTKKSGELPNVGVGWSPGQKWIWCILNVTEHLWWTDIASCKALKWLYTNWNLPWMPPHGKCHPGHMPPFAPPPATTDQDCQLSLPSLQGK